MKIFDSIGELVGKTPLLKLNKFAASRGACAEILAKLEYFNPTGSSKDRAAKTMLNEAELRGALRPDSVIIEPTSGNTGIGLAAIGTARGYRVIIVMPDSMSRERQILMKAYGAELVLTPGALGMSGAIKKAEELAATTENSFIPAQFDNPDNSLSHYLSTGPEIYEDTEGQVDVFIACVGTGGTITGTGRYLKEKNPDVKIIAVEPHDSPVLSGGAPGAHKIQGIGAGFIPSILDTNIYDEVITVTAEEAFEAMRALGKEEGVLVGISSGAALTAAIKVAGREENVGKRIVVLLPDSAERYLSSGIFD